MLRGGALIGIQLDSGSRRAGMFKEIGQSEIGPGKQGSTGAIRSAISELLLTFVLNHKNLHKSLY